MCLPVLAGLLLIEAVCKYREFHSTEGNVSIPEAEVAMNLQQY